MVGCEEYVHWRPCDCLTIHGGSKAHAISWNAECSLVNAIHVWVLWIEIKPDSIICVHITGRADSIERRGRVSANKVISVGVAEEKVDTPSYSNDYKVAPADTKGHGFRTWHYATIQAALSDPLLGTLRTPKICPVCVPYRCTKRLGVI